MTLSVKNEQDSLDSLASTRIKHEVNISSMKNIADETEEDCRSLLALRDHKTSQESRDILALKALLAFTNVQWIVVHLDG